MMFKKCMDEELTGIGYTDEQGSDAHGEKLSDSGGYEAESHAATMTLQRHALVKAKNNFGQTLVEHQIRKHKANVHVDGLITMYWQQIYAQKLSVLSIYDIKHNENFTLHEVTYLNHFTCPGGNMAAAMRTAETLHLWTQGFSQGFQA